jgi:hypothetical protein
MMTGVITVIDGRACQFQRGLTRLSEHVQVRQATLQLVERDFGLTGLRYDGQQLS